MGWRTLIRDAHQVVESSGWLPGLSGGAVPTGHKAGSSGGTKDKKKWTSAGGVVLAGPDPEGMSRIWIRKSAANPGYPSQWTFAKGRVDKGETKSSAALREVEEELGLRASLLAKGYLGPFEGGYSVTHFFLMVAEGSPGRHDKETEKVALMPWEKAMAAFASTGNSRDVSVCKTAIAHIEKHFKIDALAGEWIDDGYWRR
jgi:8-oxo-dGTP pyrophosphatase MutT (NUDIX family)